MPDELHHYMVYIEAPQEISDRVERLNKLIDRRYSNTYFSYFGKRWFSHIAVYYPSPCPKYNEEKINRVAKEISAIIPAFNISLSDYIIEEKTGYILIGCEEEALEPIIKMDELFRNKLSGLQGFQIKQKYLDMWDSFTKEEQERTLAVGRPYPFQPHISVCKVNPNEVKKAYEDIRTEVFSGETFSVNKLYMLDYFQEKNFLLAEFPLTL